MGASIYLDRLDRVRKAMADQGVDVLLVSVGHDLPYLTGYEAMPLERLTMLVVPRDGDATMVIPRLEAPRLVEQPGVFALRPWNETDDPSAIVAELQKSAGGAAVGDTVKHFLAALAENNRLGLLEGVCAKFGELMSAARGEVEVTVTSAQVRELSPFRGPTTTQPC